MPRPPDRDQRAAPARGADGVHPLLQPRAAAPDAGPRDSGPALGHAGGEGCIETDSRWAPPPTREPRELGLHSAALQRQRPDQALIYFERAMEQQPDREDVAQKLVEACGRCGQDGYARRVRLRYGLPDPAA